ncbi:MAG: methyltransferase, partial [Actinophytocola sp.]|nr:methyltransferase [Actinophytocola sp.]
MAADRLAEAGLATPRVDAELLAAHVLGIPRERLGLAESVSASHADAYQAAVERRCRREPVQHITQVAHFRHLELAVGPGVFVPRPETEVLVDWLLGSLAGSPSPLVVDLCTGSAAIALAVATEHAGARVHAVEADDLAHWWACRNVAAVAGGSVRTHLADICHWFPVWAGTVDAVTANPPYVPVGAYVQAEAGRDPERALYGGAD